MGRTLADVLAQIEERVSFELLCSPSVGRILTCPQAPILSQQRIEYERLQSEAARSSHGPRWSRYCHPGNISEVPKEHPQEPAPSKAA